ncbi:hypothetical protein RJ641_009550 [Dillenia turbinata]|uniref:Uncharacterized protein n=1 Tax=Dillenia turbinata TaxID=194707 RepID=A0AAN8V283_9MAGN
MEDSGAILSHISSLKSMLDQVNEEIEASIQTTREIESEIVKCSEMENAFLVKETELTRKIYYAEYEICGLLRFAADSRTSMDILEMELLHLIMKKDEALKRVDDKRKAFVEQCLNFQKMIDKGGNDELRTFLLQKEALENEVYLLDMKNKTLRNSMVGFMEEILEDLQTSNSGLDVDVQALDLENKNVLKEINDLKSTLQSTVSNNCRIGIVQSIVKHA